MVSEGSFKGILENNTDRPKSQLGIGLTGQPYPVGREAHCPSQLYWHLVNFLSKKKNWEKSCKIPGFGRNLFFLYILYLIYYLLFIIYYILYILLYIFHYIFYIRLCDVRLCCCTVDFFFYYCFKIDISITP